MAQFILAGAAAALAYKLFTAPKVGPSQSQSNPGGSAAVAEKDFDQMGTHTNVVQGAHEGYILKLAAMKGSEIKKVGAGLVSVNGDIFSVSDQFIANYLNDPSAAAATLHN